MNLINKNMNSKKSFYFLLNKNNYIKSLIINYLIW